MTNREYRTGATLPPLPGLKLADVTGVLEPLVPVPGMGSAPSSDAMRRCRQAEERLHGSLVAGTLPLPVVRLVDVEGRSTGALDPVGKAVAQILLRKVQRIVENNSKRHRRVRVVSRRGVRVALEVLDNWLSDAVATDRQQTLVAFDIRQCFPRLDPVHAIEALRRYSSDDGLARCLNVLYEQAHLIDGLTGIVQGLPPSTCLVDLALSPLDRILAQRGRVLRYVDNVILVIDGVVSAATAMAIVSETCMEAMATGIGTIEPHEVQIATSGANGLSRPIDFLGVRVHGSRARTISPKTLAQIQREFMRMHTSDEARRYESHLLQYFLSLGHVRDVDLVRLIANGSIEALIGEQSANRTPSARSSIDPTIGAERDLWFLAGRAQGGPGAPSIDARAPGLPGQGRPARRRRMASTWRKIEDRLGIDSSTAIRTGAPFARKGSRYRKLRFFLDQCDEDGNIDDTGSQAALVLQALARARQVANTGSNNHALGLIAVDFLATNDFQGNEDPLVRARLLKAMELGLGVELTACDRETHKIVYVNRRLARRLAVHSTPDDAEASDE